MPPRMTLLAGTAEPVELIVPLTWTLAPVPSAIAPVKPRPLTVMVLPASVVTWTPVELDQLIALSVSPASMVIWPVAPSVMLSLLPTLMPSPLFPVAWMKPSI